MIGESHNFESPGLVEFGPGYQHIKEIARGGYGYVHLFARAGQAREFVAAKFVYRGLFGPLSDPASAAAYDRALAGLQNFRSLSADSPYLLKIFDVREHHAQGFFCYSMELADDMAGHEASPETYKPRTLRNELERAGHLERLPARECLEIAVQLARGLGVLHESGFTHRDVRPSNIIFVNKVPKLADIDLLAGHTEALTSYIPKYYAAPEGTHSIQADIFSFGKTLYEICTGFSVKEYPILPRDVRHWEDHAILLMLNRVIARACERDLRKRYDSVEGILEDLQRIHRKTNE